MRWRAWVMARLNAYQCVIARVILACPSMAASGRIRAGILRTGSSKQRGSLFADDAAACLTPPSKQERVVREPRMTTTPSHTRLDPRVHPSPIQPHERPAASPGGPTLSHADDVALVGRILDGDTEAWKTFVD